MLRPRRLRSSDAIRELVAEHKVAASDLIQPLFVHDHAQDVAVESMPGVSRHSLPSLLNACERALKAGVRAVALFPSIEMGLKDSEGTHSLDSGGLLYRALRDVKKAFPELLIISDVALDPFTSHGHDGLLSTDGLDVDNDLTVERLCKMAVLEAQAGADIVAPSDMMDGRVQAIRKALDEKGHHRTIILSYAAKYASAYYGPFRDAVGSSQGNRGISKSTYQMDPANLREAELEFALDEAEGADMLMVKPAGPYLDVIQRLRGLTQKPIAGYQVSGEYAQIHAAATNGWLDYERTRNESLLGIRRAGADLILTYFATEFAESLKS